MLNASRQVGTALGVAVFASLFQARSKAAAVRESLVAAAVAYAAALALAALASPRRREAPVAEACAAH